MNLATTQFMNLFIAQASTSVIFSVLNLLVSIAFFAIPLLLIYYLIKFVRYSLSNQEKIIQKLDDLNEVLRSK